ncbi:serine protease [Mortierella alpina]|nr:serine protease [Mortierella alpina]
MKTQLILVLSIAVTSIVLAADVPGSQANQAVLGTPGDLEAAVAVDQQSQDLSSDTLSVDSTQDDVKSDEQSTEDDPSLHYVVDPSKKSTRGYDDDGRQEVVNIGPGMRTTADGQTRSRSGPRGRQRGAVLPHKYIVRLKNGADFSSVDIHSRVAERNRLQQAQAGQQGEQKLEQEAVPNQVDHEYDFGTWKGYAGQFSSDFVKELETHDDVEYVEEDTLMWAWGVDQDSDTVLDKQEQTAPLDAEQEGSAPAASSSSDPSDFDTSAVVNAHGIKLEYFSLKAPSWGLARIAERERDLAKDYSYMSSAGADVDVYIIDSGVYADHSDFGGRAFNLANFVSSERDTDTCGHGTHVAGIVAGRRYGVAKAARIQAIKVLDAEGQGSTSQVMAGINFMIKHASKNPNPKKVINMSLGGQSSRPVNDAVRVAVTQYGLPFFVAAGNTGDDACQYSPAGVKEAFAVGGSDRSDRVGWYSCTGQCVNLFAPGSGITSDWIRSTTSAHILDGTSMAAPHVAGVAALFLGAGNTYSSAQGLYDDLIRLSTKGIISGLMTNDGKTTKNLLYNKLEDISAAISVQPQDDLVALEEENATDQKASTRRKAKKMRDENEHDSGRHHHHH